jgi:hypothetical protein
MTQRKLTEVDKLGIKKAAQRIAQMTAWDKMPEGYDYWSEIHEKLCDRAKHGTTDGNPWVEPELTDEDAIERPLVFGRVNESYVWQGPFVLIRARESDVKYIVEHPSGCLSVYPYCRRATPEEIEAASAK